MISSESNDLISALTFCFRLQRQREKARLSPCREQEAKIPRSSVQKDPNPFPPSTFSIPHVACVALPPQRRAHHGALLAPEAVRVVRVKCQSVGRLRHRFQFDAVIRFWKKDVGKNNHLTGADGSPFDEQA